MTAMARRHCSARRPNDLANIQVSRGKYSGRSRAAHVQHAEDNDHHHGGMRSETGIDCPHHRALLTGDVSHHHQTGTQKCAALEDNPSREGLTA